MFKHRTIASHIQKADSNFKVLLLTGMRQVGKTTVLKDLATDDRKYITLDDVLSLKLAKEDAYLFFQTHKAPLLIDEIQYAPELFPHIKLLVDNSYLSGQVWMTGSQQFLLMKGVSESLAGRLAVLELMGFSIYEQAEQGSLQKPFLPSPFPTSILSRKSLIETYRTIWKGSFPEITLKDDDVWAMYYNSLIKTYIERDVRQLLNVGNELLFYNFMKILAARTGQELNMADIANALLVSLNTVKSWISVLHASGVIYLLPPYYENINKRIIKRPKLYFLDTGLCAYLTEWNTPETLSSGAMNGSIFETFVVSELIKSYKHNGLHPNFYYYRDHNKVEIDLLIVQNNQFYPIEIKRTATPDKKMVKNFDILTSLGKNFTYGSLICLTEHILPLTEKVNALSIWDI